MARVVEAQGINPDAIYKFTDRHTWALDFYTKHPVKIEPLKHLKDRKDIWVYVNDKELQQLGEAGIPWTKKVTVDQFRITRLQLKFLNPSTRAKKLNEMHLVYLN